MRRTFCNGLALCFLAGVVAAPGPAGAEVVSRTLATVTTEQAPLDVATSADGRWTFLLLRGGEVQILDPGGQLQGSFQAGEKASSIASSQRGDLLYVTDWDSKELRIVAVEFVHEIDVSGSPLKGPAEAAVTIAVYSDFQ